MDGSIDFLELETFHNPSLLPQSPASAARTHKGRVQSPALLPQSPASAARTHRVRVHNPSLLLQSPASAARTHRGRVLFTTPLLPQSPASAARTHRGRVQSPSLSLSLSYFRFCVHFICSVIFQSMATDFSVVIVYYLLVSYLFIMLPCWNIN